MLKGKLPFPALIVCLIMICSCSPNESVEAQSDSPKDQSEDAEATAVDYGEPHPYGGWFCPDNLGGLPPMDIQNLDQLIVVTDRLPTEEETWNGTSLIYIDTEKYPDARALEMELPRVARIHSRHNDMDELIIVFQAVVVAADTVVGYRFPNGGNGSARLGQVTFLSDEEVNEIGPSPMVFLQEDIDATREEIWKAFTKTEYAKNLGEMFNEQAFFKADWTDASGAHLNFESEDTKATGMVATVWGNLYMQIDYDYNGFHYTEKMMVGVNQETESTELLFVSGPYPKDFESQNVLWENWMAEVKEMSTDKE